MLINPKLNPTEVALSLPEVLDVLGPFIDSSDIGSCVLVNRLWNEVFNPWLWHTIDDNTFNWSNILSVMASYCYPREDGTVVEKDEKWLRAILTKNGRHIRHLSVTWIASLLNASAAGSTITRLRSLSVYHFSRHFRGGGASIRLSGPGGAE